jgi:hypothetical protein
MAFKKASTGPHGEPAADKKVLPRQEERSW